MVNTVVELKGINRDKTLKIISIYLSLKEKIGLIFISNKNIKTR